MTAENDALSNFDFDTVTSAGLFVKFKGGKPLTLRVLTIDPVVSTQEFEDKETGEVNLSTRFAFIVYNFTDNKAQILQASPNMAKKISELHLDEDFGANIKNIDIKISPTGEKLQRKYDIQVLPQARELTAAMVKEAQAIKLEEKVKGDRMSIYKPQKPTGYEQAKAVAEGLGANVEDEADLGDEPINLNDIPF